MALGNYLPCLPRWAPHADALDPLCFLPKVSAPEMREKEMNQYTMLVFSNFLNRLFINSDFTKEFRKSL